MIYIYIHYDYILIIPLLHILLGMKHPNLTIGDILSLATMIIKIIMIHP